MTDFSPFHLPSQPSVESHVAVTAKMWSFLTYWQHSKFNNNFILNENTPVIFSVQYHCLQGQVFVDVKWVINLTTSCPPRWLSVPTRNVAVDLKGSSLLTVFTANFWISEPHLWEPARELIRSTFQAKQVATSVVHDNTQVPGRKWPGAEGHKGLSLQENTVFLTRCHIQMPLFSDAKEKFPVVVFLIPHPEILWRLAFTFGLCLHFASWKQDDVWEKFFLHVIEGGSGDVMDAVMSWWISNNIEWLNLADLRMSDSQWRRFRKTHLEGDGVHPLLLE